MRWTESVRLRALVAGLLAVFLVGGAADPETLESWDAIYLSGKRIGYVHTYVTPVTDKGRKLLRVRVDMNTTFNRDKDSVTTQMRFGTIETPEGEVLRMDTRVLAARQEMRTSGDVINNQMKLVLDGGGQRQELTIPWETEVRGPYAAEQSISRKPMTAGEARSLKMFMPELNKICGITLTAKGVENVQLGGGSRSLMRIDQTTALEGTPRPEFDVTMWVDPDGQVLKSATKSFGGLLTYRTTKEAATAPIRASDRLDMILTTVIRTKRKIERADEQRHILYQVNLKDDDPAQVFPNDRRQTLRVEANKPGAVLEVKTAGPKDGTAGPENVAVEFSRPNAFVTSEDPTIQELSGRAVAGTVDPWDRAVKIERWVAQNVKEKNFETAFASAKEVAQTLSGDCTEHSVLVAAMCRVQGIPSRVAVGLIYAKHLGGFGYHAWNEVYVNRRWVALDAAFDQSTVDAVHIKLADTSLDGVSPFEAFMPLARVINKLTIEPIETR